jgi:hypothetical protein
MGSIPISPTNNWGYNEFLSSFLIYFYWRFIYYLPKDKVIMDILEHFDEEYQKINSSANVINNTVSHAKELYPKILDLYEMLSSVSVTMKYEETINLKFQVFVESLQAVLHDMQIFMEDLSKFNKHVNDVFNSVSKLKEH